MAANKPVFLMNANPEFINLPSPFLKTVPVSPALLKVAIESAKDQPPKLPPKRREPRKVKSKLP